jgi:transposase
MKVAPTILLTEEERAMLNVWLHLQTSARLALRSKIILLAAEGHQNQEIARQLRTSHKTVSLWRRRFSKGRLAAIEKEVPRGRQGLMADRAMVQMIVQKTKERLANGTRWTIRSLAKELGVSPSMVRRAWKANGLTSRQK